MSPLTRRGFLKIAGCALLAPITPRARQDPSTDIVERGSTTGSTVALTVDDCCSYALLTRLESLLDEHHLRVTFFPTGQALLWTAAQDGEVWMRLADKGHEIGYHSFDHQYPSQQTLEQLSADFDLWLEAATRVLGSKPKVRFARPPYGDWCLTYRQMCRQRELTIALWSVSWGYAPKSFGEVLDNTRAGDIVLLHLRLGDLDNLERAIPVLKAKELDPVTLSALVDNIDRPYELLPPLSRPLPVMS